MPRRASEQQLIATWDDGAEALQGIKRAGVWPDGSPLGRGHGQPYLQAVYATMLRAGTKTVEGRPNVGWAKAVSAGDWITFKISGSGGKKLVCKVDAVFTHTTFSDMLRFHEYHNMLPNAASFEEALATYRAFGTRDGTSYAQLEAEHGAIGIVVTPLRNMRRARPRWRVGVLQL